MRKYLVAGIVCFLIAMMASLCFAKTYTVVVPDEIVPYFEKRQSNPEEYLTAQVVNEADIQIEKEIKAKEPKTRDDKISELEK